MKVEKFAKGGIIENGDFIYVVKTPYMASLSNLYDKPLEVIDIKTFNFASGPKLYYVVKTENGTQEVAEDMVETGVESFYNINGIIKTKSGIVLNVGDDVILHNLYEVKVLQFIPKAPNYVHVGYPKGYGLFNGIESIRGITNKKIK